MRKALLVSVIVGAFVLSGCAGANGSQLQSDGFSTSNESVVDPELVDANVPVLEYEQKILKQPNIVYKDRYMLLSSVMNYNYARNGLLILKNSYGNIGFYSLLKDQYILNPQFVANWFDYKVSTNSYAGFYLTVHNDDIYTVYDGFANVIYTGSTENISLVTTLINKEVYVAVETSYDKYTYYKYKSNGDIIEVQSLPEEEPILPIEDEYDGPFVGNDYEKDWIDLSKHGLQGYYLFNDTLGLYTIIHKNKETNIKESVCQFNIDQATCKELGVVGHYFVYQQTLELPNDSVNFSYSSNGKKYSLETFFVDLTNGNVSTRELMGVFDNLYPLLNKTGEYDYYILTYKKINKNYALAETLTKVLDRNFVLHDDISGYVYGSFIKFENNYYNYTTKIIYDQDFKPITYIGNMNPIYLPNIKCFIGMLDGKYGLVDLNGKVALQFEYDHIYTEDAEGGYMIATKGNDVYRVLLNTIEETLIGKNVVRVAENLYYAKYDDSENVYFKSTANLGRLNKLYTLNRLTYLNKVQVYYLAYTNASYFDYSLIEQEKGSVESLRLIPSDTKGTEVTKTIPDGSTREKAQILVEGSNAVHNLNNYQNVIYSFTAPKAGYFSFYFSENYRIERMYTYQNQVISIKNYDTTNLSTDYYDSATSTLYARKYTIELAAKATIYLEMRNATNGLIQKNNIYVAMEDGTDVQYPLVYNFKTSPNNFNKSVEFMEYSRFYVSFEAPKNGYYSLSSSSLTNLKATYLSGFKYDSSKQKYAAIEGDNCLLEMTRSSSPTTMPKTLSFTFTYEAIVDTPLGFSMKNALEVTYGDNLSAFDNIVLKQQVIFDTFYIKFAPGHKGTYTIDYLFGISYVSNVSIKLYNAVGEEKAWKFNYYLEEDTDYLIMSFVVNETNASTLSRFNISASLGYAFENPNTYYSGDSYQVNYGRTSYTKCSIGGTATVGFFLAGAQYLEGKYAHYVYTRYVSPAGIETYDYVTTGWKDLDENMKPLSLKANDYVMFAVTNHSSSSNAYYSIDVLSPQNANPQTLTLGDYSNTVSSYSYYSYTNTSYETKRVGLAITDAGSIMYILVSKVGFSSQSYSYWPSYYVAHDNFCTVSPNETVYFSIYSYYSYRVGLFSESQLNYEIVTKTGHESGEKWYYNSNYNCFMFGDSSTTSGVSLHINIFGGGTIYFCARSYGYSTSDYLIISVVDASGVSRIIKNYQGERSSYFSDYYFEVFAGDTVVFTWINGSGHYLSDYFGGVNYIGFYI